VQSPDTNTEPLYVDEQRAADLIGMTKRYLERARYEGIGPRAFKIGRMVRYAVADLRAWVESGASAKVHLISARPKRATKGA
jgi:predicted DNA-binding transcriptional regulator AlpA